VNKKVYRNKVICIAGFPIDAEYRKWWTGDTGYWSNKDIYQMCKTTNWKMKTGFIPVVKVGHNDLEQALKGEITALRTGFIDVPTLNKGTVKRLCVKADFEVEYPYYDMIDKGRFPNVSVEAFSGGVDNVGDPLGCFLSGVALLGKDTAAIQHMPKLYSVGDYNYYSVRKGNTMGLFSKMFNSGKRSTEDKKKKYNAEEMMALAEELKAIAETIVDPEDAKVAVMDIAMKIEEYMAELMDSEGDEEPPAEEATSDKSDSDNEEDMKSATALERSLKKQLDAQSKQIAEMTAKFDAAISAAQKEAEAEKKATFDAVVKESFAGLVEKGLLVKQDEARFKRDCEADGVEKTVLYYSGKTAIHKTPLDVKKIKTLAHDTSENEIPASFRAAKFDKYLIASNNNKEQAETMLKEAWKTQIELNARVGAN
jgi:hypothetical protein